MEQQDKNTSFGSDRCIKCGKLLEEDAPGAYKRFKDRDAESFLCLDCLCADLGCTEKYLQARIEFLRENGCLLFPKKNQPPV
ncbi:MAG: hypothetical protein MJ137_04905 [Clostridia bacterium]|nr:hypothetical protein [Clostridia bacterium]